MLAELQVDRWMQVHARRCIPSKIAPLLRTKVSVHLVQISALEACVAEASGSQYGRELGVNNQVPVTRWGVKNDVRQHAWQSRWKPRRSARELPFEGNTAANDVTQWLKLNSCKAEDRPLEQTAYPGFFSIGREESDRAGVFGWKRQVKGEACERDHETIGGVVPPDLIRSKLSSGRPLATDTRSAESCRQR